nr:bacterial transcriptional activator domain-containing protein [Nocardia bovistercoris]
MLESTSAGYRLNVPRAAVDAHCFVERVEHALNLSPSAPFVVAAIVEESLGLWRGDALVDVVDGPLAAAAAAELVQARRAAREALLEAWVTLGEYRRVIKNANLFIIDDPLNELTRMHLITALRQEGRHAEAVEAYRSAEQFLLAELGVGPGDGMRKAMSGIACRPLGSPSGST